MKLGLLLPTRDHLLDRQPMASLLQLAVDAEAAGLDSVWVGDSPLARPRHDAFTTLAAVAARTSRIGIGTAVLLAPLRHPLLVLHQAATVDLVSCGRLILGLGAGFPFGQTEAQFAALESDYARRGARLDDTIGLARVAWSGAGGSFAGQTLSVEDTALEPRPHRHGGPPIWLAGSGRRALRRVGEAADGWLPYAPTPEQYATELATVGEHAAHVGRRPPTAGLYVTAAFDDDPDAARAAATVAIERYYGVPFDAVRTVQAIYAGTFDGFVDWLAAYRDAGATHAVVRLAGTPVDDAALACLADARGRLSPASRPSPTGAR